MLRLMKYEFLRRKRLLIGTAVALLIIEAVVLFGIYRAGNWNILSIFLTFLMVIGALVLPLLDTVVQYYSDFKNKHGYMLFMTPMNGYQIVGAKALFALIEMAAGVLLVGGCLALSGFVADRLQDGVITRFLTSMSEPSAEMTRVLGMTMPQLLSGYAGVLFLQVYTHIAIAMLALTISRVILPGNSFNWLIALLMYFGLVFAVGLVNSGVLMAFGFAGDILRMEAAGDAAGPVIDMVFKYMLIGIGTYVVWAAACLGLSGKLVNRGVDL